MTVIAQIYTLRVITYVQNMFTNFPHNQHI